MTVNIISNVDARSVELLREMTVCAYVDVSAAHRCPLCYGHITFVCPCLLSMMGCWWLFGLISESEVCRCFLWRRTFESVDLCDHAIPTRIFFSISQRLISLVLLSHPTILNRFFSVKLSYRISLLDFLHLFSSPLNEWRSLISAMGPIWAISISEVLPFFLVLDFRLFLHRRILN